MVNARHTDLDIIEELQLRRWAREHYVSPQERGVSSHPIIDEEMKRKDAETIITSRSREPMSSFVPLAPSSTTQKLHTEHDLPETPKMLQQRQRKEEVSVVQDEQSPDIDGEWIC